MRRFDIHGNELAGKIHIAKCGECDMGLVDEAEFHPWAACQEFKATHDSRKVWATIMPAFREMLERKQGIKA